MNELLKQWWREVRLGKSKLHRRQRGQSLIIVVLAFIGILALIGLGVDLGLVYVERVRVARAADAAALAAVAELPLESAAHLRALIYLQENGYDYTAGNVHVTLNLQNSPREELDGHTPDSDCIVAGLDYEPDCTIGPPNSPVSLWIDTAYSRMEVAAGEDDTDTADRVKVRVRKQVRMTFLQFVGWQTLPVEATAEAENISKLDIVIVYDKSGSMEFNTLCYGCWTDDYNFDPWVVPTIHPLPWATVDPGDTQPPDTPDHCEGWTSASGFNCGSYSASGAPSGYEKNLCHYRKTSGSPYYIVIEAEEYSHAREVADYHNRTAYSTFWVMQRNGKGSTGRDSSRGGYMSHHPYKMADADNPDRKGVSCTATDVQNGEYCRTLWSTFPAHDMDSAFVPGGPFPAPRLDYDFLAPVNGTYHFWIRGQGGEDGNTRYIHWGIDQAYQGTVDGFPDGADYDGANWGDWEWQDLGTANLAAGTEYTLNLWGGQAGFDVDRIVITTDPDTKGGWADEDELPNDFDEMETATANLARTRDACHYCDPRFAGWFPFDSGDGIPDNFDDLKSPDGTQWTPWCRYAFDPDARPDLRTDDVYKGEQPIYDAVQAAKGFVASIDPQLAQIGYVTYDSDIGSGRPRSELECLRADGPETLDDLNCDASCRPRATYPLGGGCDPDCSCYSAVITNTVLYQMDRTQAGGGTNIAQGIRAGTQILETGDCSPTECGRRGAAKIMIVLTDGHANQTSGCGTPPTDLVPDLPGYPASWNTARECTAWRAQQAGQQGIIIYSITLGDGADQELMKIVANLGNGEHFHADSSEKLVETFEAVFKKIFLRLIS